MSNPTPFGTSTRLGDIKSSAEVKLTAEDADLKIIFDFETAPARPEPDPTPSPSKLTAPSPQIPAKPGTFGAVLERFTRECQKEVHRQYSQYDPETKRWERNYEFRPKTDFARLFQGDPLAQDYICELFPEFFHVWYLERRLNPKIYDLDINHCFKYNTQYGSKSGTFINFLFRKINLFYLYDSSNLPMSIRSVEECCGIIEDLVSAFLAEGASIVLNEDPTLEPPFVNLLNTREVCFSNDDPHVQKIYFYPFRNILTTSITEQHLKQIATYRIPGYSIGEHRDEHYSLLDWALKTPVKRGTDGNFQMYTLYQKIKPIEDALITAVEKSLSSFDNTICSLVVEYNRGDFLTNYLFHPDTLSKLPLMLGTLKCGTNDANERTRVRLECRENEFGFAFSVEPTAEINYIVRYGRSQKESEKKALKEEMEKSTALLKENKILRASIEILREQLIEARKANADGKKVGVSKTFLPMSGSAIGSPAVALNPRVGPGPNSEPLPAATPMLPSMLALPSPTPADPKLLSVASPAKR